MSLVCERGRERGEAKAEVASEQPQLPDDQIGANWLERGQRNVKLCKHEKTKFRGARGDSLERKKERRKKGTDERVRHEKELMEDHRVQHRAKARERERRPASERARREGHIPLLI